MVIMVIMVFMELDFDFPMIVEQTIMVVIMVIMVIMVIVVMIIMVIEVKMQLIMEAID